MFIAEVRAPYTFLPDENEARGAVAPSSQSVEPTVRTGLYSVTRWSSFDTFLCRLSSSDMAIDMSCKQIVLVLRFLSHRRRRHLIFGCGDPLLFANSPFPYLYEPFSIQYPLATFTSHSV
jgi:hypothetical protein